MRGRRGVRYSLIFCGSFPGRSEKTTESPNDTEIVKLIKTLNVYDIQRIAHRVGSYEFIGFGSRQREATDGSNTFEYGERFHVVSEIVVERGSRAALVPCSRAELGVDQ